MDDTSTNLQHFLIRVTVDTDLPPGRNVWTIRNAVWNALCRPGGQGMIPTRVTVDTVKPLLLHPKDLHNLPPGEYTVSGPAAAALRGQEIHRVIGMHSRAHSLRQRLALWIAPWLRGLYTRDAQRQDKSEMYSSMYGKYRQP